MANTRDKFPYPKETGNKPRNPLSPPGREQRVFRGKAIWESIRSQAARFPTVFLAFGVIAVTAIAVLYINRPRPSHQPDDLGQGIVAAAGLRGRLYTRWDGKAVYKLRIEPIESRYTPGFSFVASHPPQPMSVNIRLLDSSGFALCGKEILFPFNPAKVFVPSAPPAAPHGRRLKPEELAAFQSAQQAELQSQQAQEQQRESGKDILQNQADGDGQVEAVTAEGTLPCSEQAYKRTYYWDIASNFPSLDEQQAMLTHKDAVAAKLLAEARAAAKRHKTVRETGLGFFVEGDEIATLYDATKKLLHAGPGKGFLVASSPAQAVASSWAANSTLIHYRCDQHAACSLTSAGGAVAIRARLNE